MVSYDCLVIVAHPDDVFIGAGGTILKMKDMGLKSLVVSVTDGENKNDNNKIRISEFNKSIQACGVCGMLCHMTDGMLQYEEKDLCMQILHIIHNHNPRFIITHNINDSHSDHSTVAKVVQKTIELAFHTMKENCRLKAIFNIMPIRIDLSNIKKINPDLICDISKYIEKKKAIVSFHRSQYPYVENNLKKHIALNCFLGSLASYDYAEGFSVMHLDNEISFENELRF